MIQLTVGSAALSQTDVGLHSSLSDIRAVCLWGT